MTKVYITQRSRVSRRTPRISKHNKLSFRTERTRRNANHRGTGSRDRFIRPSSSACGSLSHVALVGASLSVIDKRRIELIEIIIENSENDVDERGRKKSNEQASQGDAEKEAVFVTLHDGVTLNDAPSKASFNGKRIYKREDLAYWSIDELEAEAGVDCDESRAIEYTRVPVLYHHGKPLHRGSQSLLEGWSNPLGMEVTSLLASRSTVTVPRKDEVFIPRPYYPDCETTDFHFDIFGWNNMFKTSQERKAILYGYFDQVLYAEMGDSEGRIAFFLQDPNDRITGEDDSITSVCWLSHGWVAGGTHQGCLVVWDIDKNKLVWRGEDYFAGQTVTAIAWNEKRQFLTAGNEDGTICNFRAEVTVTKWNGHSSVILKLKWNKDFTRLASSSSADGKVCLYDSFMWKRGPTEGTFEPVSVLTGHTKSVEDVDWSPFESHLLATCSYDQTIKVWNTRTATLERSIDTGSLVNSILWSDQTKGELLTCSHGLHPCQRNIAVGPGHLILWNYPSMTKLQYFEDEDWRPFMLERNIDGSGVFVPCCDENCLPGLLVWDEIFGPTENSAQSSASKPKSSNLAIAADLKLPGSFTVR